MNADNPFSTRLLSFFFKHKYGFFLVGIVGLGVWLRFWSLDQHVWTQSGYDESRDMLVAEHILQYGESVSRGPLAAGGLGWLKNSPVYYYLIAVLWFFTATPVALMYLWASIHTGAVLLGYWVGKYMYDQVAGLILAASIAVNYQLIYGSRELLQPHLLPLFTLGFVLCAALYLNSAQRKWRYLVAAATCLLFPLHLHYGVLLIIPIGLVWVLHAWFLKISTQEITSYPSALLLPGVLLMLVLSWVFLSFTKVPFDQIYFLRFNQSRNNEVWIGSEIGQTLSHLDQMFGGNSKVMMFVVLSALFIIYLWKRMSVLTRQLRLAPQPVVRFLLLLTTSYFLTLLYNGEVGGTYLLAVFPFFLITLAVLLRQVIEIHLGLGCLLTGVAFLSMSLSSWRIITTTVPEVSFHTQQHQVAEAIANHYTSMYQLKDVDPQFLVTWYTTTRNMPFNGWGTSGVWYYLEKFFATKLVVLNDAGVNHLPKASYPSMVYMVCDHREFSERIQVECLDRFKAAYPWQGVPTFVSSTKDLSVYSVQVIQNQSQNVQRVTYSVARELL